MARTFAMGDIHGAYKALKQCLERSGFNKEEDTLIQLGDVVDGWSETYECVEELLSIPNLISIRGNHDEWLNTFIRNQFHPENWQHGGEATLKSYADRVGAEYYPHIMGGLKTTLIDTDIPESHRDFFRKQINYYKDDNENLFIHAGFNRHHLLSEHGPHSEYIFYWDRDLWTLALCHKEKTGLVFKNPFKIKEPCKDIFIGHTATINWNTDKPMRAANKIWNLDTGAGWKGKLTIMDVDTKEYWQSDKVNELYPDEVGRK